MLLTTIATLSLPFASALPHTHPSHQAPLSPISVKIDTSQRHQTIDGFGFSEAFQRSSQLHGGFGLSETNQTRVLDYLFSNTTGAAMSILRNGIGSSKDSSRDFMNSIAPVSPGSPDAPLDYMWDRNDTDQLWLSKQAQSYGVATFYANAWSTPGYMKTNKNDSNGGYICGVTDAECEDGDWRQSYANYLAQYIDFYGQEGIKITHLGFVNEPDLNQTYASMQSSGTQSADFMEVLKPTLEKRGLGDVQVTCCEATGWSDTLTQLAEIELQGGTNNFDVITSHTYSSDAKAPLLTNKHVWQTEWAGLDSDWNPRWDYLGKEDEGIGWANKIQDALVISDLSGFLYWIGAENTTVNSALIRLGTDDYQVSKRLWAFAGFSRFVRPGATRVGVDITGLPKISSDAGDDLLYTSAFENTDGRVAVVMINNGHTEYTVSMGGCGAQAEMWVTNELYNLTSMGTVGVESVVVPRRSMVSWLFA